jgi:hypothetical protein
MAHALTRNRTYEALDQRGEYGNIRTFKHGDHDATLDGQEVYILPPAPPVSYDRQTGLPETYYGWQHPNSSVADEFSAACESKPPSPRPFLVMSHLPLLSLGPFSFCTRIALTAQRSPSFLRLNWLARLVLRPRADRYGFDCKQDGAHHWVDPISMGRFVPALVLRLWDWFAPLLHTLGPSLPHQRFPIEASPQISVPYCFDAPRRNE